MMMYKTSHARGENKLNIRLECMPVGTDRRTELASEPDGAGYVLLQPPAEVRT
jgi:hypothetical protein